MDVQMSVIHTYFVLKVVPANGRADVSIIKWYPKSGWERGGSEEC